MRKSLAAFSLVALASISFGAQSSAQKTFEKITADFVAAIKKKDISWFKKNSADDFAATDAKGKLMKKEQAMQQMEQMLNMVKFQTVTAKVLSVSMKGKTAMVKTTTTINGTFTNQGKTSKLVDKSTDLETWVKGSSGWKIKFDKTLSETATVDGKPFQG